MLIKRGPLVLQGTWAPGVGRDKEPICSCQRMYASLQCACMLILRDRLVDAFLLKNDYSINFTQTLMEWASGKNFTTPGSGCWLVTS